MQQRPVTNVRNVDSRFISTTYLEDHSLKIPPKEVSAQREDGLKQKMDGFLAGTLDRDQPGVRGNDEVVVVSGGVLREPNRFELSRTYKLGRSNPLH